MKEGLPGGKLRLSPRTNLEEARLHVARWIRSQSQTTDSTQPMGYYTPEVLPFAYSLASTFTLANRWFCSVPGRPTPTVASC